MFVFDIGGKNLYFTSIDMGINGFSLSTIYETIWLARSTDGVFCDPLQDIIPVDVREQGHSSSSLPVVGTKVITRRLAVS